MIIIDETDLKRQNIIDIFLQYHCWLNADSSLFYIQLVPIVILVILIFAVIEAAGSAEYKALPDYKGTRNIDLFQKNKFYSIISRNVINCHYY